MKPDTWMPLYVADYLRDTMHLSTEEHGAYFLLLLAAWSRGGTLPNDPKQLAGMAKLSVAAWRRAAPILLPFFTEAGETIFHKRVVEEFEKAQRMADTRRQNGAKGGRPPKLTETGEKPGGKANRNLNETPTRVARPSPSPLSPKGSEDKESSAGDLFDSDPDRAAWRTAKALLIERGGLSADAAGAFFGKLLRDNALQAKDMLGPVGEAVANGTEDPKSWLTASAKARAKKRGDGLTPSERALRSNIQ